MLDVDADGIAISVQIDQDAVADFVRLYAGACAQLDVEGVGFGVVDEFHDAQASLGRMIRHFTVSAFVSLVGDDGVGRTLLHWHAGNQMWLPPGGHVEANEDPIEAVHREVLEETGLTVVVLPTAPSFDYVDPPQLPAPVTIMVEDVADHPVDGPHQHIDSIYFTRPEPADQAILPGWVWVSAEALQANRPLATVGGDRPVEIMEDVRFLGLAAIERAGEAG